MTSTTPRYSRLQQVRPKPPSVALHNNQLPDRTSN